MMTTLPARGDTIYMVSTVEVMGTLKRIETARLQTPLHMLTIPTYLHLALTLLVVL